MRSALGADRRRARPARPPRPAALAALLLLALPPGAVARVLSDGDLASVARIKPLFTAVLSDVARSAQSPDLSAPDGDCLRSTLRSLMQISDELKGYESLITIEGEITDFGDDESLRSVLRFAVENALKILDTERRRLGELSDTCSRSPLAAGKTRQALQFIDSTQAILRAVQPRL
ncbi:hypothetical protein M446_0094 [Methylobacterium sp. 4-46]|uniref:hypothetical protein n=1 Tax=unclassified Methylobacterium TaxID=2615210 RepID=UPI000165C6C3|nr:MULTISPECIES: hypothetical protein [Methylobacterium]ACA14679.1 hypothetical protein M446_0094 [Methylobacterium sp. 4-46]WFT80432.1 hypothetical protein QA634_00475 [Methylobacterium nodulans]